MVLRVLRQRYPDLRADFGQGCEHAIEFRQAAYLIGGVPDDKIIPLIVDSQKMGLRLDPETEPLLGRDSCPLG